jgi:hypothetical protein
LPALSAALVSAISRARMGVVPLPGKVMYVGRD